jgi:hypothetical protein
MHALHCVVPRLCQVPSPDDLDVLEGYFTHGGTCILGETFHKVSFGYFLDKVCAAGGSGLT